MSKTCSSTETSAYSPWVFLSSTRPRTIPCILEGMLESALWKLERRPLLRLPGSRIWFRHGGSGFGYRPMICFDGHIHPSRKCRISASASIELEVPVLGPDRFGRCTSHITAHGGVHVLNHCPCSDVIDGDTRTKLRWETGERD